jgi:hypothetical protein
VVGAVAGYGCSADSINYEILIQNFVTSATSSALTFYIDSIVNPGTFESPGDVQFTLYTSDYQIVDQSNYTMPDNLYNGTTIDAFSVSASDYTAGASPVTYYFSVTPKKRVPTGAYLQIFLP